MIARLQSNPYLPTNDYFQTLSVSLQQEFLVFLCTLAEQKSVIFSKFLESHPYFEDYLRTQDLLPYNLTFLDNNQNIIHALMDVEQDFLPNIVFHDTHTNTPCFGVIISEPFSQTYRDNLHNKLQQKYGNQIYYYICTREFLHEITLCVHLKKYFCHNELMPSLIDSLLQFGLSMSASDIHLFLQGDKADCFLRLDGSLTHFLNFENDLFIKISQKLKLLCQLDINETRFPQDGHFKTILKTYNNNEQACDIRISFFPTLNGESVVLRLPNINKRFYSLDTLELHTDLLVILKKSLLAKSGLILISGPTGSGKSTLLYNCLRFLHNGAKKIITIEDPIEQEIQGITQTQVHEELNLNFANALKYILRQDPDIIMIGEIRDYDTLEIALRAALTGHLVLASIHSSDCKTTFARLLDLGAKEYILQATLKLIVSQRLLQTLCPVCKVYDGQKYYAKGCHACYNQGYGKRILVQEVFDFDVLQNNDSLFQSSLQNLESLHKIPTMKDQAYKLYKQGIISYEESLL